MGAADLTAIALLDAELLAPRALDRAAHLRADDAFAAKVLGSPATRALWVSNGAVAAYLDPARPAAARLAFTAANDVPAGAGWSFLGLDASGAAYVAAHVEGQASLPDGARWATMREIGHTLDALAVALVAPATALDNWRTRGMHCAHCGAMMDMTSAGWSMTCAGCGIEVFPRTDPAVIVLVRDADDRALLGRQSMWPAGRMSTLAGFIEAGESAELAIRREIAEEVGIEIADADDAIRYLGSQPWPFPGSLMLGFHALAATTQIDVDGSEIVDARWFTRDELRAELASSEVRLPPSVSISRRLIEHWLDSAASPRR